MSCGVGHKCSSDSDSALLWLWPSLAAVVLIWPLAWELPYATSAAHWEKSKQASGREGGTEGGRKENREKKKAWMKERKKERVSDQKGPYILYEGKKEIREFFYWRETWSNIHFFKNHTRNKVKDGYNGISLKTKRLFRSKSKCFILRWKILKTDNKNGNGIKRRR